MHDRHDSVPGAAPTHLTVMPQLHLNCMNRRRFLCFKFWATPAVDAFYRFCACAHHQTGSLKLISVLLAACPSDCNVDEQ